MAFSTLSLSTITGVQGRPYRAVLSGLQADSRIEIGGDGSPGFSYVNGRFSSQSLPYAVSTLVFDEIRPGEGRKQWRFDISAAGAPVASVATDGTITYTGAGGGAPTAQAGTASNAGPVYTIARLLGSTSTLSLITGTNSNLTLNATTGVISATVAIAVGASQTAVVSETNGSLRVDYPVVVTGVSATPTPTPTPTPTLLNIAFAGSSTPEKYGTDNTGTTVTNATRSTTGSDFAAMGTTGAGLLAYAKIISDRTSLPARYGMFGFGGVKLIDWLANGSTQRKALVDGLIAMGGCDVLNWACGFNDVYQDNGASFVNQATHEGNLRQTFALIRSESGLPNLKICIGISQRYTGTNATGSDAKYTQLRAAEMNVAQDQNNYFGAQSYDLPQIADGIHQAAGSYLIHAARWAENGLAAMGLGGAVAETGPRIVSASAIYDTKTRITIAHNRGTDFTPATGLSGFAVSFDDGATLFNISTAVRFDATKVDITHGSSAGATPTVYDFLGKAPSVGGVLKDNSARTLPINPSIAGVKAPAGTTTVDPGATPPPTALTDTFTMTDGADLSTRTSDTGQTWTAVLGSMLAQNGRIYSTGAAASGGSTYLSSYAAPANVRVTARLRCVSNTASGTAFILARATANTDRYLAGYQVAGASGAGWYIGKSVASTFSVFTGAFSAATLTPGTDYDLDFTVNGSTLTLLVNGVQVATATDTSIASGSVGMRMSGTVQTSNTGYHFDSIGAGAAT